jgi:hypothetical protein
VEGGNGERGRARVSVSMQTERLATQSRCSHASCQYKKGKAFNATLNIQQFEYVLYRNRRGCVEQQFVDLQPFANGRFSIELKRHNRCCRVALSSEKKCGVQGGNGERERARVSVSDQTQCPANQIRCFLYLADTNRNKPSIRHSTFNNFKLACTSAGVMFSNSLSSPTPAASSGIL